MRTYANLDGLRGFAALVVVMTHSINTFLPAVSGVGVVQHEWFEPALRQPPLTLLWNGEIAVAVFFVLSGFVLSAKFFQTGSRDAVVSSALRRYVRLVVPVLSAVLVAAALMRAGLMHNQEGARVSGSTGWLAVQWTVQAHLRPALDEGLVGAFTHAAPQFDSSLWTMGYELTGSFIVFGTLLIVGRVRRRGWLYAALLLWFLQDYYAAFIAGVAICDGWHNAPRVRAALERWAPALLGVGLLLGLWPVKTFPGMVLNRLVDLHAPAHVAPLHQLAHELSAVGILIGVLSLGPLSAVLRTRPLQFLGRVSFSLYLLHVLVLGSLSCWLLARLAPDLGYGAAAATSFAVTLLVCFAAAAAFTRYVDDQAIVLSARFARLFTTESPTRPQADAGAQDDLDGLPLPQLAGGAAPSAPAAPGRRSG
ncbi:peptidoglycan/LPS O-acetylase OafA/YrhL [Motilibacter rhizosphaerae]|uniref:Peptidoglycan/LPS O-acetylase OafA/YrhL n=1 Tax=Motilibacter rhizosphaerae TaxID=598652 RepID=A0A4Q7NRP8_9ACTN|nr:acyltransferase [Motilibacter rhizosphaerae]RZS89731.1 peptidoglycan/LPS O-acetylase OafA/YrhL [Motilibacter rhizosphaerae]